MNYGRGLLHFRNNFVMSYIKSREEIASEVVITSIKWGLLKSCVQLSNPNSSLLEDRRRCLLRAQINSRSNGFWLWTPILPMVVLDTMLLLKCLRTVLLFWLFYWTFRFRYKGFQAVGYGNCPCLLTFEDESHRQVYGLNFACIEEAHDFKGHLDKRHEQEGKSCTISHLLLPFWSSLGRLSCMRQVKSFYWRRFQVSRGFVLGPNSQEFNPIRDEYPGVSEMVAAFGLQSAARAIYAPPSYGAGLPLQLDSKHRIIASSAVTSFLMMSLPAARWSCCRVITCLAFVRFPLCGWLSARTRLDVCISTAEISRDRLGGNHRLTPLWRVLVSHSLEDARAFRIQLSYRLAVLRCARLQTLKTSVTTTLPLSLSGQPGSALVMVIGVVDHRSPPHLPNTRLRRSTEGRQLYIALLLRCAASITTLRTIQQSMPAARPDRMTHTLILATEQLQFQKGSTSHHVSLSASIPTSIWTGLTGHNSFTGHLSHVGCQMVERWRMLCPVPHQEGLQSAKRENQSSSFLRLTTATTRLLIERKNHVRQPGERIGTG